MGRTESKKWVSTEEVSKVLKITPKDLASLEKEGVFDFIDRTKKRIDAENFERLKVAMSIKRDLGVNAAGLSVILQMRERIDKMQKNFNSILLKYRRSLGKKLEKNLSELNKRGY